MRKKEGHNDFEIPLFGDEQKCCFPKCHRLQAQPSQKQFSWDHIENALESFFINSTVVDCG